MSPSARIVQATLRARSRVPRRGESGSLTLEFVVVMPWLLALLFTGIQAGLTYHARQIALAAANQGVFAAAAEHGTSDEGALVATAFLEQVGGDALTGWQVEAHRDATSAEITVTATSVSLLPDFDPTVTGHARAPAEELSLQEAP